MGYKFNPLTGEFDLVGASEDNQSGYKTIVEGKTARVRDNKQMVVFGGIEIEGILLLDGQLILEE